jgi:hypothetical protein
MAKVTDMLRGHDHPRDNLGFSIPLEIAECRAAEMRTMLEAIYRYHCVLDQDELIAAWEYLNTLERAAWHQVIQARSKAP